MTELALALSGPITAVSKRHAGVASRMFPGHAFIGITNGVHAVRWVNRAFAALFDTWTPGWREDSTQLRHAALIPTTLIAEAHATAKDELRDHVRRSTGIEMSRNGIAIGFARRATAYKRPLLIFHELEKLRALAGRFGLITLLFAGKAHPRDVEGKDLIRHITCMAKESSSPLEVIFLPNYDVSLAAALCSGVDLWLNTPRAPLEASGTSGMKCALNGIPSLSIADGWWCEGGIQGVTGWTIERGSFEHVHDAEDEDDADAASLYEVLEGGVLPCFFHEEESYWEIMRNAIAVNGAHFNTHRMLREYVQLAYARAGIARSAGS
jgi:starch phosphorylase